MTHRPERGSDVEAWLKAKRDEWLPHADPEWSAFDDVLDEYRLRADTGRTLTDQLEF